MSEGERVVRQYPMEFKVDAVKLLEEQGYTVSEAANSLGIPQANLTKWRKQYREGRLVVGHKRVQPTVEEAELRRLQGEVKRLERFTEVTQILRIQTKTETAGHEKTKSAIRRVGEEKTKLSTNGPGELTEVPRSNKHALRSWSGRQRPSQRRSVSATSATRP